MSDCRDCGSTHLRLASDGRCWSCSPLTLCMHCGREFPRADFVHECTFDRSCGAVVASRTPDLTNTTNMARRMGRCGSPIRTLNGMCRTHDPGGALHQPGPFRQRPEVDWQRMALPVSLSEVCGWPLLLAWTVAAVGRECLSIPSRSIVDRWGAIEPSRAVWVYEQRRSGRTLESIGRELGVTRERVRQIEKRGFDEVVGRMRSAAGDPS